MLVLPDNQGKRALGFAVIGSSSQRSGSILNAAIGQFAVESTKRYQAIFDATGRLKDTWCNIFAWDTSCSLDAEIPHWTNPDGSPAEPSWEPGHLQVERSANGTQDWLAEFGAKYGWSLVSEAQDAQERANAGFPTYATLKEPNGHGHIAPLIAVDAQAGVWIAQAGARNFARGTLAAGFGKYVPQVLFFTHD